MKTIASVVFVCLSVVLCAQTTERPPDVLLAAGHCLAAADGDWLAIAHDNPSQVELGLFSPHKGDARLYLVEYSDLLHTGGFVYVFASRGRDSHRELLLRYRTGFRESDDGMRQVSLVDPPLGGIGTHDEVVAAIQAVDWRTWRVPVMDLKSHSGGQCNTADALM